MKNRIFNIQYPSKMFHTALLKCDVEYLAIKLKAIK